MEDYEIIELYFRRSEEAVSETRRKYGSAVRKVIGNVLRNKSDGEECENDSYMAAWNVIPPQRPVNFRAFLLKIARNQALKKLRYSSAGKRCSEAEISLEELGDCIFEEEGFRTDEELSELINGFLAGLEAEQRRIFLLRYWYFYPVKEVASACGITVSKTESVLFRTRKKLKKYLEERGYRQ